MNVRVSPAAIEYVDSTPSDVTVTPTSPTASTTASICWSSGSGSAATVGSVAGAGAEWPRDSSPNTTATTRTVPARMIISSWLSRMREAAIARSIRPSFAGGAGGAGASAWRAYAPMTLSGERPRYWEYVRSDPRT